MLVTKDVSISPKSIFFSLEHHANIKAILVTFEVSKFDKSASIILAKYLNIFSHVFICNANFIMISFLSSFSK